MKQPPRKTTPRKTTPRKTVSRKKPLHKKLNHHARQAVVPQKKNGYRPHLIRRYALAAMLAIALIGQGIYNYTSSGSVLGQNTSVVSQELLEYTNQERENVGAAPLTVNDQLSQAANLKVQDMFEKQYWAHDSPTGEKPWVWFQQAGYSYTAAGENLGKDFATSNGVVTAWLNSPEHRENLLDERYSNVGFAVEHGILDGKSATLIVALYGAPRSNTFSTSTQKTAVLASQDEQRSLVSRFGVGIQSLTPAMLGTIALLIIASILAIIAHSYRDKMPKNIRRSWRRHHGLYKAFGMLSIVVVLVTLYGGGQI